MDNNKIEIEELKIKDLFKNTPTPAILLYGTAGHGKTTFLKKFILYLVNKEGFDYYIITATKDKEYEEVGLNQTIYDVDKTPDDITNYIKNFRPKPDRKTVFIMDDCSGFYKGKEIQKALDQLFIQHRHLKLMVVLVIHTLKSVSPNIRMNTDSIIMTNVHSDYDRKIIFEYTSPKYDDGTPVKYHDFCRWMNNILHSFNKLIYNFYNDKWFYLLGGN